MPNVVTTVNISLPRFGSGKVRETFDLNEHLLMVTTDRISAFDVILPDGIPSKGEILNRISAFWFNLTQPLMQNHLISIDLKDMPAEIQNHPDIFAGRSMLVKRAQRIDFECVVRGYLAGSGWKDYLETGIICGHKLPERLRLADRLPEPIFTPSTKNDSGHDINCTIDEVSNKVGTDLALALERASIDIYKFAAEYALDRGIIIADTKFEFGLLDGQLIVIDEMLTPDSSRFWPAGEYEPGKSPVSFDKQPVRDWLEDSGWNKTPPAPSLPADVQRETTQRYIEAFEWLTGDPFTSLVDKQE
jgi:phosphoribosylaminoimidazole-succinocarboxamide synthase